jgi:hypothetical protein
MVHPMALPKYLGGWGLKNIFLFTKALAAKLGWRLISTENLWTQVVTHKYIQPDSLMEWIRRPSKKYFVASIIWKALVSSFDVIGDGLAWKVGKGNKVRLGRDPWSGNEGSHFLPKTLITRLQEQGFFYLCQVGDPNHTSIWSQEWKSHHVSWD